MLVMLMSYLLTIRAILNTDNKQDALDQAEILVNELKKLPGISVDKHAIKSTNNDDNPRERHNH